MNNNVFISCAVTGSGDTASKHPDLPKTPEQIAKSAIEAAKAGAAIAHIHVREEDGTPSRRLELYKEVVDRIRSSETDFILNLTTGMCGDLDIGQGKNPLEFGPMTDMANVMERIANAEQFLPEICTLDAGTLNFGDGSVYMGWIGLMIWIVMIGNHHANTENMGHAFSIAFLPILYGYFIKLVTIGLEKSNNG